MDKKEKIAAVVIGGSVAAGAAALIIREASKLPPGTEPPIQCQAGFHEENGVCVPDTIQCEPGFREENGVCVPDVGPPPVDPEIITFFNVSPNSGQAPLAVAISINVTGTRSRVVFKFGDGTGNVTKTSGNTHVINHNYLSAGNYNGSVEVTREDGKKDTAFFTVSVSSPEPPPPGQTFAITSFFQSKSSGNVPFDVSISASVNEPLASASIEWGDGSVTPLGSNLNADHTYSQEGIYNGKLIVISVDGQSAQRSFQVNANADVSGPQGDIIVTGKSESVYTFFANFSGTGLSYRWNFGDGVIENGGQTISHAYDRVGTFTVSVEVIDSNGKTGTDTVQVSIRETDLQAELGDVQIQRITNTVSFDYVWKLNNVAPRFLNLQYTLRLFDQNGTQVDSRIIGFGLLEFGSLQVNYNLPNLADGIYNLELEVQDAKTFQLVAFDSQIVTISGAPSIRPLDNFNQRFSFLNYRTAITGKTLIVNVVVDRRPGSVITNITGVCLVKDLNGLTLDLKLDPEFIALDDNDVTLRYTFTNLVPDKIIIEHFLWISSSDPTALSPDISANKTIDVN